MISYKDTLINGLTKDTIFKPLNKSKNVLHCKYKTLLFKILKHNRNNKYYENICNQIIDIILRNFLEILIIIIYILHQD